MFRLSVCISALALSLPAVAYADNLGALPNPTVNPGVRNELVTQDNIQSTICSRGWSETIRPPYAYTNALKHRLLIAYGLPVTVIHDYELDHLISLDLGGDPQDTRNLWLEPLTGGWNANQKNDLEGHLNLLVCEGTVTLEEAQNAIAENWVEAYRKYMPMKTRRDQDRPPGYRHDPIDINRSYQRSEDK